ncbi:MAG: Holliday junction branch migration protein RuvA [Dehalococcoidia bacterium]|nr:Holliday junction branch migration protein RuvA [Dehalococcoidia bacterium]
MIARLRGTVVDRGADHLIVDVGGVGFLVYGPADTIAGAKSGAEIALHTHLVVREDGMTLYGFLEAHQQRLFQTLIGVSGVGPKVALALLSIMDADALSFAIASGNAAALARAPGVGQKLASRIVLELREKMTGAGPVAVPGVESEEIVAALMALGYSQAEALDAVARSELPADAPVEEKVRLALSYFARARLAE